MSREKLILTKEQGRQIIFGDTDDFIEIENEITSKARWADEHRIVIQRKSDGKYFADYYRTGATESCDERPYEWDEPNFTEVFPIQQIITVYE